MSLHLHLCKHDSCAAIQMEQDFAFKEFISSSPTTTEESQAAFWDSKVLKWSIDGAIFSTNIVTSRRYRNVKCVRIEELDDQSIHYM